MVNSEPYAGWYDGYLTAKVNSPSSPLKFARTGEASPPVPGSSPPRSPLPDGLPEVPPISSGFGHDPFGTSLFGGGGSTGTETFTGTDGSAWPSPWVTTASIADINGNTGRLVTDASSYAQAYARRGGPDNGELTVKWRWTAGDSERCLVLVARGGNNFGDNPKLEYRHNPDSIWLRRSGTLLYEQTGRTFAVGTWYWSRFQWDGTSIRGRTWTDGTTEPSTWDVEVVDSSAPTTGNVLLRIENGNESSPDASTFDELTILEF